MIDDFVDIVFDGPPSHESGRFVEVENSKGASIKFGTWVHRDDGYWVLRIAHPAPPAAGDLVSREAADAVLDEFLDDAETAWGLHGGSEKFMAVLDEKHERTKMMLAALPSLPAATGTQRNLAECSRLVAVWKEQVLNKITLLAGGSTAEGIITDVYSLIAAVRDEQVAIRSLPSIPAPGDRSSTSEWVCSGCRQVVPPDHVTFAEYHDPRYGGCGSRVSEKPAPGEDGEFEEALEMFQSWAVTYGQAIPAMPAEIDAQKEMHTARQRVIDLWRRGR